MPLFGRRRAQYVSGSPVRVNASRNKLPANRTLTASGEKIRGQKTEELRRLFQPWQSRSFGYYDVLGEIKYAAQFYARMLAPLRLYPAYMNDDGTIDETDNEQAKDALARIRDPGGGRRMLLAAYGRLMFLVGESYLWVTEDEDTGEEQWEMLSMNELRPTGRGQFVRYRAPALAADEYHEPSDGEEWNLIEDTKTGQAYRLWRRHPNYSSYADATMQGVLDLCEELVLLTQAVRSRARSRLAGPGILFLDDRISPAPLEPVGDEDPNEDPFISDLVEAITTAITDEGSAAAYAPLVVRVSVPPEMKLADMIEHLQVNDPMQLYPETGLRRECIERIAIGLDMPPEVLLGLSDANHWSAWQIDEQTWKGHGQPIAQQLVDDLSSSYYRPYLREQGVADFQNYLIAFDATDIVNHPDRSKDAREAYDRRVIGKKPYRDALGFTDDDAPNQDELAEMIGVATHDSSLAWYGTPKAGTGGVETAPGEITSAQAPGSSEPGPSTGGEVEGQAPAGNEGEEVTPGAVVGAVTANSTEAKAARVIGAADLGLLRAREAAGNRILSKAKRDKKLQELVKGVRPGMVAATLGVDAIRSLGFRTDDELFNGTRELVLDAFRQNGLTDDVAGKVADTLIQHAVRTLYSTKPTILPSTFVNYVKGLLPR